MSAKRSSATKIQREIDKAKDVLERLKKGGHHALAASIQKKIDELQEQLAATSSSSPSG